MPIFVAMLNINYYGERMYESMVRILQCVNNMHRAGLETMLMNYYRNINRDEIQFDFLTHRPERSDYDDEIESLGGKMYYAPRLYPQNYIAYFRYMKQFFRDHPEYKIVHSHIGSMSFLPLLAAKKANVPVRIAHSHNTSVEKNFKYALKQVFRLGIPYVANQYYACGEEAGRFLFGKRKFIFIPNSIDSSNFIYNEQIRKMKRKELGITDEYVVGHVGRFSYQKNHKMLINIFKKVLEKDQNSFLLLIGVGEKEQEIRNQVKNAGIEEKVKFLGNRSDVNELYQAMDVFVMPSYFEGLPVVGIEAQFAGLPCVFSDKVPMEVKLTDAIDFVSLKETSEKWAQAVCKYSVHDRNKVALSPSSSAFEIKNSAQLIADKYIKLMDSI